MTQPGRYHADEHFVRTKSAHLEILSHHHLVAGVDDAAHHCPFPLAARRARSSAFSTLPLALRGSVSTNSTLRGTL
jgi:hypothetical protein